MADSTNSTNRRGIRYKPSSGKESYRAIMNSQKVQQACLQAAQRIERAASSQLDPGSTSTDVQPGKIRAHARVNAKRRIERDADGEKIWRNINYNNKKIDRILNVALNQCAIN